jgi:hypothetical protein
MGVFSRKGGYKGFNKIRSIIGIKAMKILVPVPRYESGKKNLGFRDFKILTLL